MMYAEVIEYDSEKWYYDPSSDTKCSFSSLYDKPSVDLSVVVPAYNEQTRLPPMLEECLSYLEERAKDKSFSYEVLIVDDGSKDKTSEVGWEYSKKYGCDKVRVLTLEKNRGKGGAVRLGVLRCRGRKILFADADGATKFSDFHKLEQDMNKLEGDNVIAIGSRAHLEKDSIASRSLFRTLLMFGFHFLVWLFGVRGIKDTQCGFKLYTRSAALLCFPSLHLERWAFDVELLHIARKLNIPISEVAVNWTEIDGSKIVPVWSWLEMGIDLIMIWMKYRFGFWKIRSKND